MVPYNHLVKGLGCLVFSFVGVFILMSVLLEPVKTIGPEACVCTCVCVHMCARVLVGQVPLAPSAEPPTGWEWGPSMTSLRDRTPAGGTTAPPPPRRLDFNGFYAERLERLSAERSQKAAPQLPAPRGIPAPAPRVAVTAQ